MVSQQQFLVGILAVCFCAGHLIAQAADESAGAPTTLFSVSVGNSGQSLVVKRGPDRSPALLKSIVDARHFEQIGNAYEIRVELHTPNQSPLTLASRMRTENLLTKIDRGVIVLDCLVTPGRIVLATAEGSDLWLWQFGAGLGGSGTNMLHHLRGWEVGAASRLLNRELVSLKLGRTQDGRLTADVIDKSPAPPHRLTRYEQIGVAGWEFKIVRQ